MKSPYSLITFFAIALSSLGLSGAFTIPSGMTLPQGFTLPAGIDVGGLLANLSNLIPTGTNQTSVMVSAGPTSPGALETTATTYDGNVEPQPTSSPSNLNCSQAEETDAIWQVWKCKQDAQKKYFDLLIPQYCIYYKTIFEECPKFMNSCYSGEYFETYKKNTIRGYLDYLQMMIKNGLNTDEQDCSVFRGTGLYTYKNLPTVKCPANYWDTHNKTRNKPEDCYKELVEIAIFNRDHENAICSTLNKMSWCKEKWNECYSPEAVEKIHEAFMDQTKELFTRMANQQDWKKAAIQCSIFGGPNKGNLITTSALAPLSTQSSLIVPPPTNTIPIGVTCLGKDGDPGYPCCKEKQFEVAFLRTYQCIDTQNRDQKRSGILHDIMSDRICAFIDQIHKRCFNKMMGSCYNVNDLELLKTSQAIGMYVKTLLFPERQDVLNMLMTSAFDGFSKCPENRIDLTVWQLGRFNTSIPTPICDRQAVMNNEMRLRECYQKPMSVAENAAKGDRTDIIETCKELAKVEGCVPIWKNCFSPKVAKLQHRSAIANMKFLLQNQESLNRNAPQPTTECPTFTGESGAEGKTFDLSMTIISLYTLCFMIS